MNDRQNRRKAKTTAEPRRDRRHRWTAAAVLLLVGSPSAMALTSLRIDGLITFLDPSIEANDAGIAANDRFAIEAGFDETLIAALGTETLILGTDPGSTFDLTIRAAANGAPLFRQSAADDLLGGPLLTLQDGAFDSLLFQSADFRDLGAAAFSQVEAVQAGAPFPPGGGFEILDSGDNRQLVVGAFVEVSVSPD